MNALLSRKVRSQNKVNNSLAATIALDIPSGVVPNAGANSQNRGAGGMKSHSAARQRPCFPEASEKKVGERRERRRFPVEISRA